jgi:hypothetical protein
VLDAGYTEAVRAEADFPGAHEEEDYREVLMEVRDQIESVSRYMKAIGRLLES